MSKPTTDNQSKHKNDESISMLEKLSLPLLKQKMGAFANMVNVIAEGIFIVNGQGVIEIVNPLAANFFGAPQESLVGQKLFHLLQDRYREQYEYLFLNWQHATELPVNHGPKEVLLNRMDGTWLEADLSISCLPQSLTDTGVLMVGLLHNLTKHKVQYSGLRRLASTDH
jgi:PAS domain S-box-containing protein